MGKKHKKIWSIAPLHLLFTVWKAMNILAFGDDVVAIQRIKFSSISSLWSETKLFLDVHPISLVSLLIG